MVKLSLKGAQDPADSSLQMKVLSLIYLDKAVSRSRSQIAHWTRGQPQSIRYPLIRSK
jgi:hypothetical protein